MFCVAETQAVPPVQVFDKTMVVKQMHVLEPQDLLITRADKGINPSSSSTSFFPHQTCVFAEHMPLIHSPLVFPFSHLSYVAEYILNLSNSTVPVNVLICHCNLRKLTHREPISIMRVWVLHGRFLPTVEIKHNCKKLLSLRRQLLFH